MAIKTKRQMNYNNKFPRNPKHTEKNHAGKINGAEKKINGKKLDAPKPVLDNSKATNYNNINAENMYLPKSRSTSNEECINKDRKIENMHPKKLHPDHRYIEGLASNDEKIIREILVKFKQVVIRYIISLSGTHADGEDAFQDALIEILNQAIKPDFVLTCNFSHYIKIIAKRRWIECINRNKREQQYIESQENMLLDMELFPDDYNDRLAHAMAKLPPDCQKVLHLYYYMDWCIEAIAKEMNYSLDFGRQKLYRSRKKLKKLLQS